MSDVVETGRIWVALDALERSEAPLGAAVGLARILQAELAALFVENVDLFRMADFPQAFETRLFGQHDPAGQQGLEGLEAALRAQASALQRQLVRTAGASGLRWSFRIARGRVLQQALEVAGAGDCVVLPSAAIATSLAITRTGSPTRAGAATRAEAVLPQRGAIASARPAGLRLAGSPQLWALPGAGLRARRVLEIAHRLLDQDGPGRLVLPEDPREAAELRDWLRERGWQDEWREASLADLQAARQHPGGGGAGILLLPRPADGAERARLEGSLRRAGWPIVMV